jgi:universal stress protein E
MKVRPLLSVVVGTDFSSCSAVALTHGMRIAGWSGAAVHAVHVIDTYVATELTTAMSPLQKGIREGLVKGAEHTWQTFCKSTPGAEKLILETSINNRMLGILKKVREDRADLLVLGAFGTRKPDVGFGSVANACVRKAPCDVLLVRETQTGPFKVIVAAVDFSSTSARALACAAHFAANEQAKLHVVHVYQSPWYQVMVGDTMIAIPPEDEARYRSDLQARLTGFASPILASHGATGTLACVEDVGHRHGIAGVARSLNADLVVLGTRGSTNMRDMLLGSTAERTLAEARCSVLAVRAED